MLHPSTPSSLILVIRFQSRWDGLFFIEVVEDRNDEIGC